MISEIKTIVDQFEMYDKIITRILSENNKEKILDFILYTKNELEKKVNNIINAEKIGILNKIGEKSIINNIENILNGSLSVEEMQIAEKMDEEDYRNSKKLIFIITKIKQNINDLDTIAKLLNYKDLNINNEKNLELLLINILDSGDSSINYISGEFLKNHIEVHPYLEKIILEKFDKIQKDSLNDNTSDIHAKVQLLNIVKKYYSFINSPQIELVYEMFEKDIIDFLEKKYDDLLKYDNLKVINHVNVFLSQDFFPNIILNSSPSIKKIKEKYYNKIIYTLEDDYNEIKKENNLDKLIKFFNNLNNINEDITFKILYSQTIIRLMNDFILGIYNQFKISEVKIEGNISKVEQIKQENKILETNDKKTYLKAKEMYEKLKTIDYIKITKNDNFKALIFDLRKIINDFENIEKEKIDYFEKNSGLVLNLSDDRKIKDFEKNLVILDNLIKYCEENLIKDGVFLNENTKKTFDLLLDELVKIIDLKIKFYVTYKPNRTDPLLKIMTSLLKYIKVYDKEKYPKINHNLLNALENCHKCLFENFNADYLTYIIKEQAFGKEKLNIKKTFEILEHSLNSENKEYLEQSKFVIDVIENNTKIPYIQKSLSENSDIEILLLKISKINVILEGNIEKIKVLLTQTEARYNRRIKNKKDDTIINPELKKTIDELNEILNKNFEKKASFKEKINKLDPKNKSFREETINFITKNIKDEDYKNFIDSKTSDLNTFNTDENIKNFCDEINKNYINILIDYEDFIKNRKLAMSQELYSELNKVGQDWSVKIAENIKDLYKKTKNTKLSTLYSQITKLFSN